MPSEAPSAEAYDPGERLLECDVHARKLIDDSKDMPKTWVPDGPQPMPYRDFWVLLPAILVGWVVNLGVFFVFFKLTDWMVPPLLVALTGLGLLFALIGLAASWVERRNAPSLARIGILLGVAELLCIVAGLLRVLTASP
jgi:hypothetical protein